MAESYVGSLRQRRSYRPNAKSAEATRAPVERVLRGLVVLARFLIDEVNSMEDSKTEDKQRRLVWNRIPTHVHDPAGLAHELLWRAEQELPDVWEDEDEVKVGGAGKGKKKASGPKAPAAKSMRLLNRPTASRTWKFSPS